MKPHLDMDKIAKGLGAERKGPVAAKGGYFGAMQLAAEVQARFRHPVKGGRATDPSWTEQRLVRFAPDTLKHLEAIAKNVQKRVHHKVGPLQVAAVVLEQAAKDVSEKDVEKLIQSRGASRRSVSVAGRVEKQRSAVKGL